MPAISVLIVSADDSPSLRRLLGIVARQATGLNAECILVMNTARAALSAETRAALAALCTELVFEGRPGKSQALNRGVDLCRAPVIACTDDDVEPAPGWLAHLTRGLVDPSRDPRLVACGGPVVPVYDAEVPTWFRTLVEAKPSNFLGPRHMWGGEPFDYALAPHKRGGVPIGANVAFLREVFDTERYDPELGPNRATGFRGGEDSALARRLLSSGYRIRYAPDAVVRHPVSAARCGLDFVRNAHTIRGRERVKLARKLDLPIPARRTLWTRMVLNQLKTPWRRAATGNPHPPEEFRWRYQRGMLRELADAAKSDAAAPPKQATKPL